MFALGILLGGECCGVDGNPGGDLLGGDSGGGDDLGVFGDGGIALLGGGEGRGLGGCSCRVRGFEGSCRAASGGECAE